MATVNSLSLGTRLAWTVRQGLRAALRHWSAVAVTFLLAALLAFAAGACQMVQHQQTLVQRAQALVISNLNPVRGPVEVDAVQDLAGFQKVLPLHEDIPNSLRDLIVLAQTHRLMLAKGDYKSQVDVNGQFFQYSMTFPVQGDAQSIERFILAALAQHKTLALESVQFKRERIESKELEAKIQWTLFTQLPAVGSKS